MAELEFWHALFLDAVQSVQAEACLSTHLPNPDTFSSVKVIAAGKAAGAMAGALDKCWPNTSLSGIAVCPPGYECVLDRIDTMTAAHPVPDETSVCAADRALEVANSAVAGDLLLVLLSGGGSSLLCAPVSGMSLADKQALTGHLLRSGAPIETLNLVRSAFSRIKAGGLAAGVVKGVQLLTLAISDVVGDDPAKIASGPTVYSPLETETLKAALEEYGIAKPASGLHVRKKPQIIGDYRVVANAAQMLAQARGFLCGAGFRVVDWGADVQGEAQAAARAHARQVIQMVAENSMERIAFLSGGELTVTVTGAGEGGPNQEYLLTLMSLLEPGNFSGFAADTDGCDGVGGAAGAFFCPEIHQKAHQMGAYSKYLKDSNSSSFFKEIGGSFQTAPTKTNVNDLRVLLYEPISKLKLT